MITIMIRLIDAHDDRRVTICLRMPPLSPAVCLLRPNLPNLTPKLGRRGSIEFPLIDDDRDQSPTSRPDPPPNDDIVPLELHLYGDCPRCGRSYSGFRARGGVIGLGIRPLQVGSMVWANDNDVTRYYQVLQFYPHHRLLLAEVFLRRRGMLRLIPPFESVGALEDQWRTRVRLPDTADHYDVPPPIYPSLLTLLSSILGKPSKTPKGDTWQMLQTRWGSPSRDLRTASGNPAK
ncbi:hypothetical protein C8F04DRAFT_1199954 [Mycena alexandri]|uniref:Uncharacterized protein n=1 Tax=Mycena alexandri TaxID=1745969 RepID=A0AAD6RYP4_9AGAR|nr:hypothetical protein C8F04DRAFT_1199954 [Mycena alexandri]